MTTTGDAAPGRSPSDWIVRLHRDTTRLDVATSSAGSTIVLAGPVVAHRGQTGTDFGAVSIHRLTPDIALELTRDVLDLRCEQRDLPNDRNAAPTTDLDHVVHVLCSRFADPQAIERFMADTRGLIDGYTSGREAWFEVLAYPTDQVGGTSDEPIVDDIFVGRYPTLQAWHELHAWEPWKQAIEALEAQATTLFHLVVAPTINRLAAHR